MDEEAMEELRLLRTLVWVLPLVVSVVVALISALASYFTARHSTRREAQRELLAKKQTTYVAAQMAFLKVAAAQRTKLLVPNNAEVLADAAEATGHALEMLITIQLIGSEELTTYIAQMEGTSAELSPAQMGKLLELMIDDVSQLQDELTGL